MVITSLNIKSAFYETDDIIYLIKPLSNYFLRCLNTEDTKKKAHRIPNKLLSSLNQRFISFFQSSFPCIFFFNSNDYTYFVLSFIFMQRYYECNRSGFLL